MIRKVKYWIFTHSVLDFLSHKLWQVLGIDMRHWWFLFLTFTWAFFISFFLLTSWNPYNSIKPPGLGKGQGAGSRKGQRMCTSNFWKLMSFWTPVSCVLLPECEMKRAGVASSAFAELVEGDRERSRSWQVPWSSAQVPGWVAAAAMSPGWMGMVRCSQQLPYASAPPDESQGSPSLLLLSSSRIAWRGRAFLHLFVPSWRVWGTRRTE